MNASSSATSVPSILVDIKTLGRDGSVGMTFCGSWNNSNVLDDDGDGKAYCFKEEDNSCVDEERKGLRESGETNA